MKTAIMTDTNSGISVEEGRSLGIYVIPMPVIIDDRDYLENVSITHEETYAAITAGKNVRTSQPAPDTIINMWEKLLNEDGYDSVVYIPMSSSLSNSCETAIAFSRDFDGKVQVADNPSRCASPFLRQRNSLIAEKTRKRSAGTSRSRDRSPASISRSTPLIF